MISLTELNSDFWRWINDNIAENPDRLRLANHRNEIKMFAIDQIDCRQRSAKKLKDTLAQCDQFLFDSTLAAQQSTSDLLAEFHASLIEPNKNILDMTGGLGIDALHLSKKALKVVMIEQNHFRSEIARHNFRTMQIDNIEVVNADSVKLLSKIPDNSFDTIFIDPARRGQHGQRLFAISQCEPDVTSILDEMLRVAPQVIIKASPMLDITDTINRLPSTKKIISLGTTTECKELVIECQRNYSDKPSIESITLSDKRLLSYIPDSDTISSHIPEIFALPSEGDTLFVPYPSLTKINQSAKIAHHFDLKRIAQNVSLFHAAAPEVEDFPGEKLIVKEVVPFNKKALKQIQTKYPQMDVSTRNFPLTAQQLSQKLKLKPGNQMRLFGVRDHLNDTHLIITQRS